ncbi:MAG: response regulator [Ornithinimicrobium sp.]
MDKGKTVLVADDDTDIRELVVFKLEQSGYDVVAVGDGEAALSSIRERPPHVAILDIMMPGRSGLDVLHEIREDDALRAVRVILLTARSRDLDVDAGFSTGADDYVIKPFSPRELMHRVESILTRRD